MFYFAAKSLILIEDTLKVLDLPACGQGIYCHGRMTVSGSNAEACDTTFSVLGIRGPFEVCGLLCLHLDGTYWVVDPGNEQLYSENLR